MHQNVNCAAIGIVGLDRHCPREGLTNSRNFLIRVVPVLVLLTAGFWPREAAGRDIVGAATVVGDGLLRIGT